MRARDPRPGLGGQFPRTGLISASGFPGKGNRHQHHVLRWCAAEAKFEAVRRRLETAGSTELQEGLLGRWVESARDKVHVVAKAGPHHHNRSTILEAEEDRK